MHIHLELSARKRSQRHDPENRPVSRHADRFSHVQHVVISHTSTYVSTELKLGSECGRSKRSLDVRMIVETGR